MRLTMVAQVCSTVAGFTTWNSVLGSPVIHQSHRSPSSGTIDLADGLFLDGDALHGLNGHHGGHADAVSGFDGLAQRGGVQVMIHGIGHVLLGDGFDGQAQLVADGLAGVPGIGGLKRNRDGRFAPRIRPGSGRSRAPWPGPGRSPQRYSCRRP